MTTQKANAVTAGSWQLRIDQRMQDIEARQWDALTADGSPFLSHAFLNALEESGSVSAQTGWQPCHITVHDETGLLAALPLYLKHHSWGEYVFDWAWADAYQRYGEHYYPKLVSAIPYTPSQSPRLLLRDPGQQEALYKQVHEAVISAAKEKAASSWHVLFPAPEEAAAWQQCGLIRREACQFHWHNDDYRSFDDFLARCSSRKRKNLRKERQSVQQQGLVFKCLEGRQISQQDWDIFYRFYQNTYHIRGQEAYLSRDFFSRIADTLADRLFLIMVEKDGVYVAGALFFKSSRTLYGRYWGCAQDYDKLHFETCYYQGIDYCIRHGLQRFDAGAQGEHKLRRGFEPVTTLSCHWINSQVFRPAIADFCRRESEHIAAYRQTATKHLPFKR